MPLIKDAAAIYLGSTAAAAVYAGNTKVWPGFDPSSIAGLTLWIDASQDSYPDGTLVPSPPDHSGVGRTFTAQGDQPVYRTAIRGRPSYSWEGGNSYGLDAGTWNPGTAGLTFLFVGEILPPSNYPMMVVHGSDADGFEMRLAGNDMQIVLMYTTYGIVYSHSTPDTAGNDTLHAVRVRPGAGSDAWVNTSMITGGAPTAMPNITQALYVARRQGGYPYYGTMREVLVYAGPVPDADMTTLIDYLCTKWGLP